MNFKNTLPTLAILCFAFLSACKAGTTPPADSSAKSVQDPSGYTIGAVGFPAPEETGRSSILLCFYEQTSAGAEFQQIPNGTLPLWRDRLFALLSSFESVVRILQNRGGNQAASALDNLTAIVPTDISTFDTALTDTFDAWIERRNAQQAQSKSEPTTLLGQFGLLAKRGLEAHAREFLQKAQDTVLKDSDKYMTIFQDLPVVAEFQKNFKETSNAFAALQDLIDSPDKLFIDSPDQPTLGTDRIALTEKGLRAIIIQLNKGPSELFHHDNPDFCSAKPSTDE